MGVFEDRSHAPLLREEDALQRNKQRLEPLRLVPLARPVLRPPRNSLLEGDLQVCASGRERHRADTDGAVVVVDGRERVGSVLREDGELVRGVACVVSPDQYSSNRKGGADAPLSGRSRRAWL